MKYEIELDAGGKKESRKGNLPLQEILELGDGMIEKAIRENGGNPAGKGKME